jgi:hypothetical protein
VVVLGWEVLEVRESSRSSRRSLSKVRVSAAANGLSEFAVQSGTWSLAPPGLLTSPGHEHLDTSFLPPVLFLIFLED